MLDPGVRGAAETVAGDATSATRKRKKRARSCKYHEVGRTCTGFGTPFSFPGVLLLSEQCGCTMKGDASIEWSHAIWFTFTLGIVGQGRLRVGMG